MSMTITWTLGEILSKVRRDAGLDQATLAATVGIARNSLSNYERGRSVPPFDVAVRIAAACDVPLEVLASVIAAETTTAPAEAEAVDSLSQHSVRPKGLEPLTF
ncbi:helix-turn-helix transcriptional regulator [Microbacterium sp. 2P01SA-2]|uniref:helix-turn-helix domain-containing protein n=1 Tax=unclassified Microbacterium TaxID=2609290 RepID=UPI0039A2F66D